MSVPQRRRQAARRARWVPVLRLRADQHLGRNQLENVDEHACRHCGAWTATAGPIISDDDWDAEYTWREQIRSHEAGECRPTGIR